MRCAASSTRAGWFSPASSAIWISGGVRATMAIRKRGRRSVPRRRASRTGGRLVYQPQRIDPNEVMTIAEDHVGRSLSVFREPTRKIYRLRANTWLKPGRLSTLALHLVNYDVALGIGASRPKVVEKLALSVPILPDSKLKSAEVFYPDGAAKNHPLKAVAAKGTVSVTLPELWVYAIVKLSLA
jgi:hypothetical protein